MRCPLCSSLDDKVIDSRLTDDGDVTRRRRECGVCGYRFTTFERADEPRLRVRKRTGETVPFDPDKLEAGVRASITGRPISDDEVDAFVAGVVARLRRGDRIVSSEQLGLDVLEWLADLDAVAYVRFASVYKGFEDPEDFQREIGLLKQTPPKSA